MGGADGQRLYLPAGKACVEFIKTNNIKEMHSLSHAHPPHPCLFFCGFLWKNRYLLEDCVNETRAFWGPVLERSDDFPFGESAFYESEMGQGLLRTYILYERSMVDPAGLVDRKVQAADLERRFAEGGRRTLNLDPGYMNRHQVVIATFKNFAHRIYLGQGVYAHLEYTFVKGDPQILPWTYPDFRRDDHRALFRAWRRLCPKDYPSVAEG